MNEQFQLPNETKIRFCNAMNYMIVHCRECEPCGAYIDLGEGDLCGKGKEILAQNLVGAEMNVFFPGK